MKCDFDTLPDALYKKIAYLVRRSEEKAAHSVEDFVRKVQYDDSSQEIVNKKEIRVLGLRRSGNHAIINWICQQSAGNTVFINHVRPLENPYRNQYESQKRSKENLQSCSWKYRDLSWWEKEKNGEFTVKDCLVYSYEDQEVEKVSHPSYEKKKDLYIGKSAKRYDVIVMRDPFNLFASRLQTKPTVGGPNFSMLEIYSRRYTLPELWISYAKECLEETSYLRGEKIFVNYNRWFVDANYRRSIASSLNLEFTDEGLYEISKSGNGSSFDGDSYAGEAYKMDVLNRWKSYVDDKVYIDMLKTEGVLDYSTRLFGSIPGTDVLFR